MEGEEPDEIQSTLNMVIKTCSYFIEGVPEQLGMIKVKEYNSIDDTFLSNAFNGFEKNCFKKDTECQDWKPEYFGVAINYLIAEHFGKGTVCKTSDWLSMTEKAMDCLSDEEYNKNQAITKDIILSYLAIR
jgi:hypothetical protein